MQLATCTWAEVESYLGHSTGIVLPIGSTEQHGPNGLIGTDAICADAIARGIGDATGGLVAPVLPVGMAQHHMGFPGTMTLRPSTLLSVFRDCITSLAQHGFRRFYFVNGHGGNIPVVQSAIAEVYGESGDRGLLCELRNWWLRPPVVALARELYGEHEGIHATASEVSLTQHVFPDYIKRVDMEPAPPAAMFFGDGAAFRRRFPDGRMGSHPGLSRPEHGKRFLDAVVADLAKDYEAFAAS
ncbi:MAG: creatininase family protein [Proteobacteria bacterium]|nr:creatininase family protein [Pseudomonadota bacterium]MDA1132773.1 creatininase family protein [Pseudomonadota bacterium]